MSDHEEEFDPRALSIMVVGAMAASKFTEAQDLLKDLDAGKLRSLVTTMATQVDAQRLRREPTESGPRGVCQRAVDVSARAFNTTPEAMLSGTRQREVADARAVAMAASRRSGLTLTAVSDYFGMNHTTVMYSSKKVARNPRLARATARVYAALDDRHGIPIGEPVTKHVDGYIGGPDTTLQRAALHENQSRTTDTRDEPSPGRAPAVAAPGR